LIEEAYPLLRKHYHEIAHYKDIALDPDFEKYILLENEEILRVFTARDENDVLVGYIVFIVAKNLHYKNTVQANQDVMFIDHEKRGVGRKFIEFCDEELKKEGVISVSQHIKAAHNYGTLLIKIGYELVDLVYSRRLN
jgi:hypothetical protein